ncbi:hypothetical protein X777_03232 [Ooceraea biroi]|uniref:Uncharacterized protein n=1 Tax=Ooceraea biroi TaxID=2015173 RepID=A0A026WL32_OOCBI|nr:hypothetical protein X777_03232 [Ooceraea biroi]
MDSEEEEEVLLDDSNYHSDAEGHVETYDRIVPNPELLSMVPNTVMYCIQFFYMARDSVVLCSPCLIRVIGTDLTYVRTILRHQTNAQSELFGRTCHNCRLPVYIIVACNMCPMCTWIAFIPSIEGEMEDL